MKPFRFSLERVLQVRRLALELEEQRMYALQAQMTCLMEAIAELGRSRAGSAESTARSSQSTGADLRQLSAYHRKLDRNEQVVREHATNCDRQLQQQRQRYTAVRKQVRLLEKLRMRRLAEWRLELDRETDRINGELYLTRWKRRPKAEETAGSTEGGNRQ